MATAVLANENHLTRRSSKRDVNGAVRCASNLSDTARDGATGLTNYVGHANLDWEPKCESAEVAPKQRSLSFRRAIRTSSFRKKTQVKLPKNWSRVQEENGTVYYLNSVTNQRSVEVPSELPTGWAEGIDKETGRVCYANKSLRKTVFELPSESSKEGQQQEGEDSNSLFGRTVSLFGGRKPVKRGDAEVSERQSSFRRKSTDVPKNESTGQSQRTVFISCSALIRETKLCVGAEMQEPLEKLMATLAAREILAELAVKQLMELVGSTIVQQAGLSVMNAQKGVLPHGWLEYVDDASGRPYYYNVHNRETTWYKPKAPAAPLILGPEGNEDPDGFINLETAVETHTIAISAEI